MTDRQIRKFNPGTLQSDEEVIRQFVVRNRELDIVLEVLSGNLDSPSCQHVLVVGPRGRGKTMLLARVAAELRRDGELSGRLFPVRFMEDSQEIFNLADFWLDTLFHLEGESARHDPAFAQELRETHAALTTRWREETLEKQALAAVLDAADRLGKKLVLMVENLQALSRNVDDDFGWKLRRVLQSEPQIILVASATSRFKGLDDAEQPFFEMFRIVGLEPLGTDECRRLWQVVSGDEVTGREIRPLEILTGGSPRLLVIVSGFGRHLSLRQLMEELVRLIDDHTEYFRSHLETLGKTERRVYLAAMDLWQPSSTGEISARARMDIRTVSTMLGRLVERGAVIAEGSGRKRMYRVAERLYSIYYKLRRERDEAAVVESLIRFMTAFYSKDELLGMRARMIAEAARFPVIREGIERAIGGWRQVGSDSSSNTWPVMEGISLEVSAIDRWDLNRAMEAALKEEPLERSIQVAGEAFASRNRGPAELPDLFLALLLDRKAAAYQKAGDLAAAISAYSEVVRRFGGSSVSELQLAVASALFRKAELQRGNDDPAAAISSHEETIERFGTSDLLELQIPIAWALYSKADAHGQCGELSAAITAYDEVVARFAGSDVAELKLRAAWALSKKGDIQRQEGDLREAARTYEEVVARFGDSDTSDLRMLVAWVLFNQADMHEQVGNFAESAASCAEVVDRFGGNEEPDLQYAVALALSRIGMRQAESGHAEQALETCGDLERRLVFLASEEKSEFTWRAMCVRALALMIVGNEQAAMESFRSAYFAFAPGNETEMREMLQVVPRLIAAGSSSKDLVEILLSDGTKADALRPLVVALRQHAGETVREPAEVLEVAADVRAALSEEGKAVTSQ